VSMSAGGVLCVRVPCSVAPIHRTFFASQRKFDFAIRPSYVG